MPADGMMGAAEVQQELDRLLADRRFASAGKLSAFLQFIVGKALAGQSAEIKEYAIALAVYGRKPDYDPKVDSIVRVEASRLRSRLKEYYEAEGASDPVVIELPKGAYVPVFRSARVVAAAAPVRSWRWPLAAGAAVLAAGVAFLAMKPAAGTPGIVIVPFKSLSAESSDEALALGITKDIESELTSSGRIKVMEAGKANLALQGSIRHEATRIHVVAQLLDRRDGSYIWSDRFDREWGNAIDAATDIGRRIAGAVELQAVAAARERAVAGTPRAKAMELYRLGRAQMQPREDGFLRRGAESYNKPSLEAVQKAIGLLEQSVAADPSYAQGWATLATFYQFAGEYDPQFFDKAVAAARRAVGIEPKLGDAHATLGYIDHIFAWRFREAVPEFRAALEQEPRQLTSYRLAADCLELLGRADEAMQMIEQARVVYPNHPAVETMRVQWFYHTGKIDEMANEARRLVEAFPDYPLSHWALGLALEAQRHYPEAVAEFNRCLTLSPGDSRCTPAIGHAYALAGRRGDAERIMVTIRNRSTAQIQAPYEIALVQNGLHEESAAIANLRAAFDQHEVGAPYLKTEYRFANLRSKPEVRELLARIGL